MGGKDANRQPKLQGLRQTPQGWVRMAACKGCGHRAALPIEALIRKFGETALVEFALITLKCTACDGYGAIALMLKLCEPGCARQRG